MARLDRMTGRDYVLPLYECGEDLGVVHEETIGSEIILVSHGKGSPATKV